MLSADEEEDEKVIRSQANKQGFQVKNKDINVFSEDDSKPNKT